MINPTLLKGQTLIRWERFCKDSNIDPQITVQQVDALKLPVYRAMLSLVRIKDKHGLLHNQPS